MTASTQFLWKCHPHAEALLLEYTEELCRANSFLAMLQKDLQLQTSTRLFDWLDHIAIDRSDDKESVLEELGFVTEEVTPTDRVLHHPGAQFPRVVVHDGIEKRVGLAIKVDQIDDFLMAHCLSRPIEGSINSDYRRCLISAENGISCWVVERRGTVSIDPIHHDDHAVVRYLQATEQWATRPRDGEDEDLLMINTLKLAEELVDSVGRDTAAYLVLEVERRYWQARNTAGQMQKNRQDRLGMGWANHDHHTFRSSRRHFAQLIRLFEILGFSCREHFYAGDEAGWGAQVMENPRSRLVVFLDVDLLPHEVNIDYRYQILPELDHLNTVGLWCEIHGDSILQSGMHHLEAQFLFEALKEDLETRGVGMMPPFSNFPFLRQAFTKGEFWPVASKRLAKLLADKMITKEQGEQFRLHGAVGSHMENLQRREGYKGFNQKNVSSIIRDTDPRNLQGA